MILSNGPLILLRLKSDQHRIIKAKADTKLRVKEEELEQLKQELASDQEALDASVRSWSVSRTTIADYEHEQQRECINQGAFEQRASVLENKKKLKNN